MPDFKVNIDYLRTSASGATRAKRTLNTQSYEISRIRSRLIGLTMIPVRLYLITRTRALQDRARRLAALSTALKEAAKMYESAENHILDFEGALQNPAFTGPQGQYGGKQHGPMQNYEDVAEIVRKYHPDWSDKKIRKYLEQLNKEGCGYVAMINTIFLQYKGRPDEFEKTFGFPMYDEDGNLNYNALITDFYTAKDDPKHNGTRADSREQMWEEYCKDHGIDVDVRDVEVTAENYRDLARDGEIVVGLSPVILYQRNADGSYTRTHNIKNAGHAMTVTGVTDDGRLIVSSWGETYYLDADLSKYNGHCDFQQVVYK